MIKNGIDISHWQGKPDFSKLSKVVDFIILKAGGSDNSIRYYTDKEFKRNYEQCKKYGIPCGCYFFVGKKFTTAKQGQEQAKYFYNIIKGLKFEYPIYLDVETTTTEQKKGATDASIAFCDYLEDKGYYVGIYASDVSGFKERLDLARLKPFDKWVARYGKKPQIVPDVNMWQYTEHGVIDGIKDSNVDMNECYIDYPKIIIEKHFNGY